MIDPDGNSFFGFEAYNAAYSYAEGMFNYSVDQVQEKAPLVGGIALGTAATIASGGTFLWAVGAGEAGVAVLAGLSGAVSAAGVAIDTSELLGNKVDPKIKAVQAGASMILGGTSLLKNPGHSATMMLEAADIVKAGLDYESATNEIINNAKEPINPSTER